MAKPGTKKFTTPIAAYVSDGQNSNEPSAVLARRLKISGSTPSTLETTSLLSYPVGTRPPVRSAITPCANRAPGRTCALAWWPVTKVPWGVRALLEERAAPDHTQPEHRDAAILNRARIAEQHLVARFRQ
jgi:hypothetical protein